jgi:predicted aminopeptidase
MNTTSARLVVLAAVVILVALSLSSCWYAKQASYFLSERAKAQPVGTVRSNPAVTASVLKFLDTVDQIRDFSITGIGLAPTKNYTRFVTLEKDYVADVVSACASDSFERHYWHYPVLGNLPYKGFYDKTDAQKEAANLKKAGLDVIVRPVEAFSSLGYFTDPLYSFMVQYSEDVLAELIIHESAHATLFIKGADQFNEEFATFVGRKGAERYLEERYGPNSSQISDRQARSADGMAFVAFLKETAILLDAVYLDHSITKDEMLRKKAFIIQLRAETYKAEAEARFSSGNYRNFDMASINNAFIDMYRLYEEDLALYEDWFGRVAGGSLQEFIATLKELAARAKKDIKLVMAERLDAL